MLLPMCYYVFLCENNIFEQSWKISTQFTEQKNVLQHGCMFCLFAFVSRKTQEEMNILQFNKIIKGSNNR